MKSFTLFLVVAIQLFASFLYAQERTKMLINQDWKFKLDEQPGAERAVYADQGWQLVQLPHDASIYGPFVKDTLGGNARNGYRPRHVGWYRKQLNIESVQPGKKYILEFEGVYRAAKVWVNGLYCGQFLNGYLDFEFDITDKIKPGNNSIAVRYDNTYKESSRWYTGEGINRNVYLHTVNSLHIARYGTYITTPSVNAGAAKLVVETNIVKSRPDSLLCTLVTNIISPAGIVVGILRSVLPMAEDTACKLVQELKISQPVVWDLHNPRLYKAVSRLFAGDHEIDTYETSFGIRTVDFNTAQGFLLNGRKVFLKGVCLHHDLGPLGAASFDAAWDKRLTMLKEELGCNAIRLSHNPYPKYVLDWCDRNGMLVFDEAYDKWDQQYYGPRESFQAHWRRDVETFIRRDRNHPSVFIWSVGNEVFQQIKGTDNYGITILKEMVDLVHALEPTRKVTAALYPARWNSKRFKDTVYRTPAQMAFHMDVMSVNYMENFFRGDRERFPQLIPLVSEISTGARGETFFNYDHSFAAGQFYWGGTEYIGESFGWPSKGWINGPIDLGNNLKPAGHSISSFYKQEPVVFATVIDEKAASERMWNDNKIKLQPSASHWNWQGRDSVKLQLFSNCDKVQVRLNGKQVLEKNLSAKDQNTFTENIAFAPGTLEVIGMQNSNAVTTQTLRTAGKAWQLVLKTDKPVLKADGLDLAYLTVTVVDKNGVVVPSGSHDIRFTVSGNGTNAGVVNGDITSSERFQDEHRSVYQGQCQLIIRASANSGTITVKANAPGLKGAAVELEVQ